MSAIASTNMVIGLPTPVVMALPNTATPISLTNHGGTEQELREAFTQFVGETFYGQMFKAMRSTVGKPAYFHGGRAEEVFQSQLDQTMAQELTKSTAATFAEPMFDRQFPQFAKTGGESNLAQLVTLSRN